MNQETLRAKTRRRWFLGAAFLLAGLLQTRGGGMTHHPPIESDPLFECPVTLGDLVEEQTAAPDFISVSKYEGYLAALELGNFSYAKECVKGLRALDAKIESYLLRCAKKNHKGHGEVCRKENLTILRQALAPLRKKYRCGEYWRLLHNHGIAKSDLAWLRVLDYMDQAYPPTLPTETFTLEQVK